MLGFQRKLTRLVRGPFVVALAVLTAIAGAFQVAGVTTMLLATIILAGGVWVFLSLEVACSTWISNAGRYFASIVLAASCLTGLVAVLLTLLIADLKMAQRPFSNAEVQVTKAVLFGIENATTKRRSVSINIFFNNVGTERTTGIVHANTVIVTPEEVKDSELAGHMARLSKDPSLAMLGRLHEEMVPHDPNGAFFTIPFTNADKVLNDLAHYYTGIVSGKLRVYFLVVLKYKDPTMSPSTVGVSETCEWFQGPVPVGGLDVFHRCGNRAYIRTD